MNTQKISVVMSTYNREGMVSRMIESILSQDFEEFELLIINNGSTDNTDIICREFEAKDGRIRYFFITENNGPAAARNMGIDNARTDYVLLVDDDDYCQPNMFSHLFGLINKYNADIAITGCVDEYENEIYPKYSYDEIYVWNKIEGLSEFLKREKFHTAPATKLFRKSLFNDIKFISGVHVDDIHIVYKLFVQANRIAAQGIPTYRFYKHSRNMTAFINTDKITKEILEEYLKMQIERVKYISEKVPELTPQVRYAKWSYMISMVEKIKTGRGNGCEKQLSFMKESLLLNHIELIEAKWTTEREKSIMNNFVL